MKKVSESIPKKGAAPKRPRKHGHDRPAWITKEQVRLMFAEHEETIANLKTRTATALAQTAQLHAELATHKKALAEWAADFEKFKNKRSTKQLQRQIDDYYQHRDGIVFKAANKALLLIAPELERLSQTPGLVEEFAERVKKLL